MATRRQLVFGFFVVMAAMPLVWLSADQDAGDKLLRWTSGNAGHRAASQEPLSGQQRRTASPPMESVA